VVSTRLRAFGGPAVHTHTRRLNGERVAAILWGVTQDEEPTFKGAAPDVATKLIVAGAGISSTHVLPAKGELVIGRGSDVQVKIPDGSVSRRHALLKVAGRTLTLEDLGSANGTWVNEAPLESGKRVPVKPGDVLRTGDVAILVRGPRTKAPVAEEAPVVVAESMKELHALVDKVAPSAVNVLVLGETGTGKEVVARALHARSPRAGKPFLGINCAALSETLLESELFGHEKGAFTGADRAHEGLLEAANGGTVFLDEVGELPPSFQAKLLRVLEERQVRRLGASASRPIDVRIVAATNRDLDKGVLEGTFRKDLYFRLNGFILTVPPLRERAVEIEPLIRHYVTFFAREAGKEEPSISPEALARMKIHRWPGNVRELRNVVQRAVLLCGEGPIELAHLPPLGEGPAPSLDDLGKKTQRLRAPDLKEVSEAQRIQEALEQCAGNQTRAADLLGISRRSLVMKLTKYGMPRPRKRES